MPATSLSALRVDHAVKLHMAVLHGDADGLGGIDGVAVQRREAIHGARDREPDAVIHRRDGIDVDVVDHILDAGCVETTARAESRLG